MSNLTVDPQHKIERYVDYLILSTANTVRIVHIRCGRQIVVMLHGDDDTHRASADDGPACQCPLYSERQLLTDLYWSLGECQQVGEVKTLIQSLLKRAR